MAKEVLFRMQNFTRDLLEVVNVSGGLYSVDSPVNVAVFHNQSGQAYYVLVNPGDVIRDLTFKPQFWQAKVDSGAVLPILDSERKRFQIDGNVSGTSPDVDMKVDDLIVGADYRVTFTVTNRSGISVNFKLGTSNGTSRSTNGTFTEIDTCTVNGNFGFNLALGTGLGDTINVSNVKVEQMPGDNVDGEFDYKIADGAVQDLTEGGKRFVRAVSVFAPTGATIASKSIRGQLLIGRRSTWAR